MTFIISPQWFSTHGVNDRDFAHVQHQIKLISYFNKRYAFRIKRDTPNAYYTLKVRRIKNS